ncbi:MAG: translation initiation factor IF-5A [Candidatus Aenigmarchaeota archaeon]|nr:translation initiation factor IF-5A [Candidatus Aenigmarchaeota archaeon]
MSVEQVEAKHFKRGNFIMVDDVACRVLDNSKSAPGKHGHLKCKIEATGLLDGKKRMIMKPGEAKIPCPIIDKRAAQVLSLSGKTAQLMDMVTYDTFDTQIPDDVTGVTEGGEVEYWVIAGTKVIRAVK